MLVAVDNQIHDGRPSTIRSLDVSVAVRVYGDVLSWRPGWRISQSEIVEKPKAEANDATRTAVGSALAVGRLSPSFAQAASLVPLLVEVKAMMPSPLDAIRPYGEAAESGRDGDDRGPEVFRVMGQH